MYVFMSCFCCKKKTAYEMRISDWSADVCSSDLIVAAAWEGKTVAIGANSGLKLERRRVNGEPRLEISGFDPRSLPALKAKGCFTEIIQFKTRLFVPVSRAAEIVKELEAR